jgi:hypothetical protein
MVLIVKVLNPSWNNSDPVNCQWEIVTNITKASYRGEKNCLSLLVVSGIW